MITTTLQHATNQMKRAGGIASEVARPRFSVVSSVGGLVNVLLVLISIILVLPVVGPEVRAS